MERPDALRVAPPPRPSHAVSPARRRNRRRYHYGFSDYRPERYHWRIWDLRSGVLLIRFRSPAASSVELVGSFTDSQSRTLQRDAEGIWHSRCPLSASGHEYKLLVDGHRWDVDPHVTFRPGPAGENNYIHVVTRA